MSDAPDATCVRHRRGFSLIEVLGAVAILGIWYVILASLAMQGMRLTGESQRRLRASLIADRILADFELMAAQGEALEPTSEEMEEEPFTILVEVLDLSEQPPEQTAQTDEEGMGLLDFFAEQEDSVFGQYRNANWLLAYLRQIQIRVSWEEGPDELAVSRTSYIWDAQTFIEEGASTLNDGGSQDAP